MTSAVVRVKSSSLFDATFRNHWHKKQFDDLRTTMPNHSFLLTDSNPECWHSFTCMGKVCTAKKHVIYLHKSGKKAFSYHVDRCYMLVSVCVVRVSCLNRCRAGSIRWSAQGS